MEQERNAKPWDFFKKNLGRVETDIAEFRLSICKECPQLIALTGQCKECGCFMAAKVKLPNAFCPLHKWDSITISITEEI